MLAESTLNNGNGFKWFTKLADAQEVAAADNKLIFVGLTRAVCGNCRFLFDELIPDPDCNKMLQESFVCVASDCDQPESEIMEIGAQYMPYATMLPICIYITPEGDYLHGSTGRLDKQVFTADLRHAVNQAARLAAQ